MEFRRGDRPRILMKLDGEGSDSRMRQPGRRSDDKAAIARARLVEFEGAAQ